MFRYLGQLKNLDVIIKGDPDEMLEKLGAVVKDRKKKMRCLIIAGHGSPRPDQPGVGFGSRVFGEDHIDLLEMGGKLSNFLYERERSIRNACGLPYGRPTSDDTTLSPSIPFPLDASLPNPCITVKEGETVELEATVASQNDSGSLHFRRLRDTRMCKRHPCLLETGDQGGKILEARVTVTDSKGRLGDPLAFVMVEREPPGRRRRREGRCEHGNRWSGQARRCLDRHRPRRIGLGRRVGPARSCGLLEGIHDPDYPRIAPGSQMT